MDKQTFCSSQSTSNTARYAAALYRQGTRAGQPGCRGSGRPLSGREAGWGVGGTQPAAPRMLDAYRGQADYRNDAVRGLEEATSKDF